MAVSPTWSVYQDVWGAVTPQDGKEKSVPTLLTVNSVPPEHTLRDGGLKKKGNLQRGAQGAVYVAHDQTRGAAPGELVAVKRLFKQPNSFGRHGVAETVLREATLMHFISQKMQQKNMDTSARPVELYRIVEAPYDELCLVMELCDIDLRRMIVSSGKSAGERCPRMANLSTIKYILRHVVSMVLFLHQDCGIIHRDIKLSNILVKQNGDLRLSDFGSCRFTLSAPGEATEAAAQYTPPSHRTTMIYQPLEALIGCRTSGTELDVWSLGVLFAELVLQEHLFKAGSELGVVSAIYKLLGGNASWEAGDGAPPPEEGSTGTLPLKFPPSILPAEGLDLLRRMLELDPQKRITLAAVLQHPFLTSFTAEEAAEGHALFLEKTKEAIEKANEVVTVSMGKLSF
ncbi:protein kinase [Angomonas deanei]|nr:protein kinase [Angomonas deanei]|eukprot:EPY31171.1 protein kinase [Angomonas deanei]